ncbi:MAG: type III-B CRISPR module RAMP protein Cmr4 [Acidobacteria bacterium]|nr:type III-B CRISPR module RAMP protein Cmr4 [Acidobacteriota bacterium]MBI3657023.1 type III-B CRISPR module RAMP protein Cmr4 [Acidobacteriota bacterium]
MTENMKMYWLHGLTPLHVGAGRGMGYIDLPIMREKVTNWPLVPGSTVKGVLRDHFENNGVETRDNLLNSAFGRADQDGESANSGSLVFTDARLVCLPVRSFYGTFAWVTSPLALRRLQRDLSTVGIAENLEVSADLDSQTIQLPQGIPSALKDADNKVYFEDLDFTVQEGPINTWAEKISEWTFPGDATWQDEFKKRFAVIPNDSFDFLCETRTEVHARVRIDPEKKVVAKGALWYEEFLPAEVMLAGVVWCDRVFPRNGATPEQLMRAFCATELKLQIGGKATIGKGQVRCIFERRSGQ